jgi:hypothetical protein
MTSSNFVGCSTQIGGLAAFENVSTNTASREAFSYAQDTRAA